MYSLNIISLPTFHWWLFVVVVVLCIHPFPLLLKINWTCLRSYLDLRIVSPKSKIIIGKRSQYFCSWMCTKHKESLILLKIKKSHGSICWCYIVALFQLRTGQQNLSEDSAPILVQRWKNVVSHSFVGLLRRQVARC